MFYNSTFFVQSILINFYYVHFHETQFLILPNLSGPVWYKKHWTSMILSLMCIFIFSTFLSWRNRQVCSTVYLASSLVNLIASSNPAYPTLRSWSYPYRLTSPQLFHFSWYNSFLLLFQAQILEVTFYFLLSCRKLFL